MLSHNGKFMVYTSPFSTQRERLKTVVSAVVRIAERLGANIEISQRDNILSIFVYYKNGGKEKIPVYCDWGKKWNEKDVYHAIRSVVYALSLHPEYSFLQTIREVKMEWQS